MEPQQHPPQPTYWLLIIETLTVRLPADAELEFLTEERDAEGGYTTDTDLHDPW